MARLQIAPTKSNLLAVKEQLGIAQDGYELLEQKREILVMELMQMVERVKSTNRASSSMKVRFAARLSSVAAVPTPIHASA